MDHLQVQIVMWKTGRGKGFIAALQIGAPFLYLWRAAILSKWEAVGVAAELCVGGEGRGAFVVEFQQWRQHSTSTTLLHAKFKTLTSPLLGCHPVAMNHVHVWLELAIRVLCCSGTPMHAAVLLTWMRWSHLTPFGGPALNA
eukprot:scaffold211782_cov20-Tisochrysis_lutea.AAC.1